MSVPARAKVHLESVITLKTIAPTSAEASQAAAHLRAVVDDTEVALDLRAKAGQFATGLAAPPTTEDGVRRESLMTSAAQFARMTV
jgi:hypothetical protein